MKEEERVRMVHVVIRRVRTRGRRTVYSLKSQQESTLFIRTARNNVLYTNWMFFFLEDGES